MEVVALKVSDIDSKRMMLRVAHGKGRKDRFAMLGACDARCEDCAHATIACNSCRNRHCPKCQSLPPRRAGGAAAREWMAAREAELLPIAYFHVVFTLPSAIKPSDLLAPFCSELTCLATLMQC